MRLTLRYDMRAPEIGEPAAVQYPTVLDHAEWAERLGFETVYIAEHHGAEDGYCASPMTLAAAIFGRTRHIGVHLSALIAVLHNPLFLAEDLATLDLVSGGGRLEMTLGIGYRPHEYEMFGVEKKRRVPILEETIEVLRAAWTGEPFEFQGHSVMVRPRPVSPPPIYIGGSSEASCVRAARMGDGFRPAGADKSAMYQIYREERERLGLPVPPEPPASGPMFLFISDDPARDIPLVAPHFMYTSNSNAEWARERGVGSTSYRPAISADDLAADPNFEVVTPDECILLCEKLGPDAELVFQPLMGGLPVDLGWRSLRLFETDVLPRLVEMGYRAPLSAKA